jgi:hypothetical protein
MFREHVIQVGNGRGFVLYDENREPIVVTACHCLPSLPRADRSNRRCVRDRLIAPLRERPSIAAECLFADPIADIAILGRPPENSAAFNQLVSSVVPLRIGRIADERRNTILKVQLLSLLDYWFSCDAIHARGALWLTCADDKICSGQSGSPLLAADGSVIAVLVIANGDPSKDVFDSGGPQPCLAHCLPAWVLRG